MTDGPRVLVVDDDRISRESTTLQLRAVGYVVDNAGGAEAALQSLRARPWDVVLTDLRMPGMDGLELLRVVRRDHAGVDVVVMTAFGSVDSAVEAMQLGAVDYLSKPFSFAELDVRLRRLSTARTERRQLERLRGLLDPPSDGIIGRCAAMRLVRERVALFARHAAPVLITGATGTGKELISRAIHDASGRRSGPFVAVACGAVPQSLAESTFFGHERGAFTGADRRRKGCFEQAEGGTILLDDVDDLPVDVQVKLLRVLQESELVRVGGNETVRIDVRVVATTKVDLEAEVAQRRFRSDLYYRLRGLQIELPPLRERGDDVLLLADHFLRVHAAERQGPPARLSIEAATVLRQLSWPGGVRELRRTMEAADILAAGEVVGPEHLPAPGRRESALFTVDLDGVEHVDLPAEVARFERALIAWAMDASGGRQTKAAELLGLARTTLQTKLERRG